MQGFWTAERKVLHMEQKEIQVTVDGQVRTYPQGISYGEIVKDYEGKADAPIILVLADGRLRELHKHANRDCTLSFITTKRQYWLQRIQAKRCVCA